MKRFIPFLFTSFLTLVCYFAYSQSKPVEDRLQTTMEAVNIRFCRAVVTENLNELMQWYGAESTCMPDYQPVLNGDEAIREYYREIFSRRETRRFDKKITEMIDLGDKMAEIGTFSLEYTTIADGQAVQLSGKYFNIWAAQPDGTLQLQAESFGYFKKLNDPKSQVVAITKNVPFNTARQKDKDLDFELQALNALMEKGVRNRDGILRSGFFTADAVVMPHADTLQTGIAAIRKYLIAYNAGNAKIDTISVYNNYAERLGNYVLEYPRFYVKWSAPGVSGTSKGGGIRLWRREPDCALRLHREISLHEE